MKIAFVVREFPQYSETFIFLKFRYLLEAGHDVHVFCLDNYNRSVEHPPEWRSRIHVIPSHKSPLVALWWPFYFLFGMLFCGGLRKRFRYLINETGLSKYRSAQALIAVRMITRESWELIHCHFLSRVDFTLSAKPLFKCPLIVSVLGFGISILPYKKQGGMEMLDRRLASVDGLIYSSEFLRQYAGKRMQIEVPEKILPPEVDITRFTPRIRAAVSSPVRILSVGRLHWAKGYPLMLYAVKDLIEQGLKLEYHIVGGGDGLNEIEYLIREMGLSDMVVLLGAQSADFVAEQMDWANIYLGLSQREDFGSVFSEAAYCGLPVIASCIGGIPEATSEGVNAILVERGDWRAASQAIQSLIENQDMYEAYSRNGIEFAKKFSADRIGQELEDFYRKVTKEYAQGKG